VNLFFANGVFLFFGICFIWIVSGVFLRNVFVSTGASVFRCIGFCLSSEVKSHWWYIGIALLHWILRRLLSACFVRGSFTSSSFLAGRITDVERGSRWDTKAVRIITLVCSCSIFAVRLSILDESQC